jgi:phosphoserine phosphatase RsbU/P
VISDAPPLRIHTEDEQTSPEDDLSIATHIPGLEDFIGSFRDATGWEVDLTPAATSGGFLMDADDRPADGNTPLELNIVDMASDLVPGQSCVHREKCDGIVKSVNQILADFCRTRRVIDRLHAEMATTVPVLLQSTEEDVLLEKLEAVIKQGMTILNMSAGGVYLLDDETRELSLRIQVGLGIDSLLAPSRPLKGSVADLEALVGNSVVIKDATQQAYWNIPEHYPSGICVPVKTQAAPLGTLWFFSDHQRELGENESQIAEMIGGRLSAELERESAVRSGSVSKKFTREIERARTWQTLQVPAVIPELDGWSLIGSEFHNEGIGGSIFDFRLSDGGNLFASVGDVQGGLFESGLAASSLRGAMVAHGIGHPQPSNYLHDVNNTMWNCSLGDQIGSLFHIQLQPETGIAKWANAGQTGAVVVGAAAEPYLVMEGSPLGTCENETFDGGERVLLPNSVLFAFNEGFRELFRASFRRCGDDDILNAMTLYRINTSDRIHEWIAQMMEKFDAYRSRPDVSFIAIQRKAEPSGDEIPV